MTDPDQFTDYASVPPIYRVKAARRARLTIATGAVLAALSTAVLVFLLLVAAPEDQDGFLLLVMAGAAAAGVWSVMQGVRTLRRNRAEG